MAKERRWRRRLDFESPAGAVEVEVVVVVVVVAGEDTSVASAESVVVAAELAGC